MSNTPEYLQGQITALKEILVTIIDVLAADNPDILRRVRGNFPNVPLDERAFGPHDFAKGRQVTLNNFATDLTKVFVSRSRG